MFNSLFGVAVNDVDRGRQAVVPKSNGGRCRTTFNLCSFSKKENLVLTFRVCEQAPAAAVPPFCRKVYTGIEEEMG